MNILIGLLLFFLGSFCGLTIMCLVQAGAKADESYYRYLEQKNAIGVENNKEA